MTIVDFQASNPDFPDSRIIEQMATRVMLHQAAQSEDTELAAYVRASLT